MQYYRTTKRIGEGAHGYVMKATHIFTGKEVAIKKLLQRSNYHRDNNFLCTIREVETMKQVEHEHVCYGVKKTFRKNLKIFDLIPTYFFLDYPINRHFANTNRYRHCHGVYANEFECCYL